MAHWHNRSAGFRIGLRCSVIGQSLSAVGTCQERPALGGRLTHGQRADHYWDQLTTGGGFKALNRLRDEHVIGAFGIGANEVEVCIATLPETQLDAILRAGQYSLPDHDAPDAIVAKVRRNEDVAARHNVPVAAAALQSVLAHPQVASVIPGIDSAARLKATMHLYQTPTPPDFWAKLRHEGLLQPEAPTP